MSYYQTSKLVVNPKTAYPCDHPKGLIHAALEADRAGYQFLIHQGKVYALVRFEGDRTVYTCECEIDDPEFVAKLVKECNEWNGVEA